MEFRVSSCLFCPSSLSGHTLMVIKFYIKTLKGPIIKFVMSECSKIKMYIFVVKDKSKPYSLYKIKVKFV